MDFARGIALRCLPSVDVASTRARVTWIAYGGDARRRDEALSQMARHHQQACFGELRVGGRSFYLYGWNQPRQYAAAASSLGLPEPLLRLACWFYEGFPEDEQSTRAQIASYMQMLEGRASNALDDNISPSRREAW